MRSDRRGAEGLRYIGEIAPRRGWVAFLLTVLCPGLGVAYLGGVAGAVLINTVFVSLWVGFVAVWTVYRFDPLLPGLMLAAQWVVVQLMLAFDVSQMARRAGPNYVLRDSNHWVVYAVVATFSYALPLLGLQQFTSTRLWPVVPVERRGMEPTLLEGDRVLVDALWHRANPWRRADLVAFQPPGRDDEVRIARIVGLPGDEVVFAEGRFFVNDAPVMASHPSDETLARLGALSGEAPASMQWVVEQGFGRAWAVSEPVLEAWGRAETWSVPDGHLFVVHDERTALDDSRSWGPVPLNRVVGRPHLVAYHVGDGHAVWMDRLPYGVRGVAWALASEADSRAGLRSRRLVQAAPAR